jgi:hypothetical protein
VKGTLNPSLSDIPHMSVRLIFFLGRRFSPPSFSIPDCRASAALSQNPTVNF